LGKGCLEWAMNSTSLTLFLEHFIDNFWLQGSRWCYSYKQIMIRDSLHYSYAVGRNKLFEETFVRMIT